MSEQTTPQGVPGGGVTPPPVPPVTPPVAAPAAQPAPPVAAPAPAGQVPTPPLPPVLPEPAPQLVTPEGASDGVVRCPKCGASDVKFNQSTHMLMCEFCRHTWMEATLDQAMGLSAGIEELRGTVLSTAAADITSDEALVTLKCGGCGAEVVINTDQNLQARCHWCKHVLSLNNRIPNGAVPDGILPFSVTKEQAMASIAAFVNERKTFALRTFWDTFQPENVMGVYMPYMTVDGNLTVRLDGHGEVLRGTVRVGENRTEYKADEYTVSREVDLEVDDLIVETNADKANINSSVSTNNVINAVLPFDVKNIVRFNANYLGAEFTSERRDMNVDSAESYAADHFFTIARGAVQTSVSGYDRGVRWEAEQANIKGTRWVAVLLPVWLYGFVEVKRGQQITHYIAVNGRTGATMGSVPINTSKAAAVAWGTAAAISAVTWPLGIVALVATS